MNVAKVYASKSANLADLSAEALYELAAPKTPVEVREEVDRLLASGEIVTKATVDALRRRADHAEIEATTQAGRIRELEARDREARSVEIDAVANGSRPCLQLSVVGSAFASTLYFRSLGVQP
jgi:hypothetical protein